MARSRRRRTLALADLPALYDYADLARLRRSPRDSEPADEWNPVVTDDWPDFVPITEAELDLFETYFGELIDELFGPKGS